MNLAALLLVVLGNLRSGTRAPMISTTSSLPRAPRILQGVRSRNRKPAVDRRDRLTIAAPDALAMARRRNVAFIDLRDWETLDRTGWIEGSLHVPAGEFAAIVDPAGPLHKRLFEPGVTFVFYGGPKTSPLAAARKARHLGVRDAVALRGGFGAWKRAGGRVTGHPESALPALRTAIAVAYQDRMRSLRRLIAQMRRRFVL